MRGRSVVDRLLGASPAARRWAVAGLVLLGLLMALVMGGLREPQELSSPWWPATPIWALAFLATRGWGERGALVLAVALGTGMLNLLRGDPPEVAALAGVVIAIEVTIVGVLLPHPGPSATFGVRTAVRILAASTAGALVAALLAAGMTVAVDSSDPAGAAYRLFAAHLSAGVMLLPFPYLSARFFATSRRWELAAEAVVSIGVVVLVFQPGQGFELSFAVFPVLMWLVLRFRTGIVMAQVAVVSITSGISIDVSAAYDGVPLSQSAPYMQTFWVAITATCLVFSALRNDQAASDLLLRAREDLLRGGIVDEHAGFLCLGASARRPARLEVLDSSPQARMLLAEHLDHDAGTLRLREDSAVSALVRAALADTSDHQGSLLSPGGNTILVRARRVHHPRIGYIAVAEVTDVTERLQEEEAWERTLLLERAGKRQLAELDRQKDVFVGAVNHELRAPVTNILAHADLLAADSLPESARRRTEVIVRNAERLAALVSDVIATTRTADALPEQAWREVDLMTLVTDAAEDIAPHASVVHVTVHVVPRPPVAITTGVLDLQQILENLLENAVKFAAPASIVSVAVRERGEHVVVELANAGHPLTPDEQRRAFDRFSRGAQAVADAVPGSGVGLAIVQGLARRIGAVVTLASDEAGITTVRVRLPRSH